jgi:hypothetical protein
MTVYADQAMQTDNSRLWAIGFAILTIVAFKIAARFGLFDKILPCLRAGGSHLRTGASDLARRLPAVVFRKKTPETDPAQVNGGAHPTQTHPGNTPGNTPGNPGNGSGNTPGNPGNGSGNTPGNTPGNTSWGAQDTSWGAIDNSTEPPSGYHTYRPGGNLP